MAFLTCIDCDLVTNSKASQALSRGWLHLLLDQWNDLWRCPACADRRHNR